VIETVVCQIEPDVDKRQGRGCQRHDKSFIIRLSYRVGQSGSGRRRWAVGSAALSNEMH